jgi:hypothetical protein
MVLSNISHFSQNLVLNNVPIALVTISKKDLIWFKMKCLNLLRVAWPYILNLVGILVIEFGIIIFNLIQKTIVMYVTTCMRMCVSLLA